MAEGIERETRWLVRDTADGLYLRVGAVSRAAHGRPAARFVSANEATPFTTVEEAANGALLVPTERFETIEFVEETVERRAGARAAETVPPPRQVGVVSASWVTATGSMSARDLLDTLRVVESRSVDPRDLPSVVAIFEEVTGRQPRMR